jgi:hypothetical protein
MVSPERRSHRFLYVMTCFHELTCNENPLLTNEFSETHNKKLYVYSEFIYKTVMFLQDMIETLF